MSFGGEGLDQTFLVSGAPAPGSFGGGSRRSRLLGGTRGAVVSSISTLVVLAGLTALFLLAPGSAEVRHYFFDPHAMWQSFVGDPKLGIFSVGKGLVLNIEMFLVCEVVILAFALLIAVIRQLRDPIFFPFRMLAIAYTDFFRGVPLILVVVAIGQGFPALGLQVISTQGLAVYGSLALILSYSAYVAEVYRAGIESVHESQMAAARSLGLTQWQSLRFVIVPQAVRRVVPPLLNDFISLQKDTALVSVIGAIEATRSAGVYAAYAFNYSGFTVAALLFLLLTIPLARFTDRLIERDRRRRQGGGAR